MAIREYSYRFKIRLNFSEDIISNCPDKCLVILSRKVDNVVKSKCFRKLNFLNLTDAKRNLFMNTSRLITLNDRHFDLHQIQSNFPNHSICFYEYSVLDQLLTHSEMSQ